MKLKQTSWKSTCRYAGSQFRERLTIMTSRGLLAAKGHFGPILPRILRGRGSSCLHGRPSKRSLVASGDVAARGALASNGLWDSSIGGRRDYSQLSSSRELALSKPLLLQRYQVFKISNLTFVTLNLGTSMAVRWGEGAWMGPFSSLSPPKGRTN